MQPLTDINRLEPGLKEIALKVIQLNQSQLEILKTIIDENLEAAYYRTWLDDVDSTIKERGFPLTHKDLNQICWRDWFHRYEPHQAAFFALYTMGYIDHQEYKYKYQVTY